MEAPYIRTPGTLFNTLFCFFFEIGMYAWGGWDWTCLDPIHFYKHSAKRTKYQKQLCFYTHQSVSKNGRIYDHRPRIISRIMPRIIPTNHTLVLKPCFQASGESYPESHLRNIPRIIPPNPYLPFNTLSWHPYVKKQPSPHKGIFLKDSTIHIGTASPCSEASRLIPNEILKDEELNATIAASLPRSHDFEVGRGWGFGRIYFFLNQGRYK